ncbi:MAG TPA: hypothetical protein ENN56_01775, partial [Firmicutes bacterium]|nr:hypothetical protein [Bacillota bacterium]
MNSFGFSHSLLVRLAPDSTRRYLQYRNMDILSQRIHAMNAKERVRATINRQPVDRIPLGFYCADCDTVERVIGRKTYVRNKIGIQLALWEGRRDEVVESLKADSVEFYQKIDTVDLLTYKEAQTLPPKDYVPNPPKKIADDLWEDRNGRIYKASYLSNELVCVHDPNKRDVDEFTPEMFPEPSEEDLAPPDPSQFEAWDHFVSVFAKDRYIAGHSGGMVALTHVGGQESGLMMYVINPEVVHAASRRAVIIAEARDTQVIRPEQDGVLFDQDMAGTNGPMISPKLFREHCFPYMKQRVAHVKSLGQQILLHNCGDNRLLMPMFAEAGIECYQSLQTNAGMTLENLQRDFSDHIVFWGGLAVENLIEGTPEDVRRNVR